MRWLYPRDRNKDSDAEMLHAMTLTFLISVGAEALIKRNPALAHNTPFNVSTCAALGYFTAKALFCLFETPYQRKNSLQKQLFTSASKLDATEFDSNWTALSDMGINPAQSTRENESIEGVVRGVCPPNHKEALDRKESERCDRLLQHFKPKPY